MSALLLPLVSAADASFGQSPFRYDDDLSPYRQGSDDSAYARFKYLPLDDAGETYLSFGGDLRERFESSSVALLGLRDARRNSYLLTRGLFFGDLHVSPVRAFVQLGSESQSGRKPSPLPTDVDRADIAQAFVDYRVPSGEGTEPHIVRAGRFEMSFDEGALIGLRDGPNVRQSWEGARYSFNEAAFRMDAFWVRPVEVRAGWFDDDAMRRQTLDGVHLDWSLSPIFPAALNAFWYHSDMPSVALWPRAESETTDTVGARAHWTVGACDGSVGVIAQTGVYGTSDVRAWAAHLDMNWTARAIEWTPRIGLRLDVLSGGVNDHGVVRTFNALYPNYAFSTEATIEAPANLVQPALTADIRPSSNISVRYTLEGLWRYSSNDAFYAAPLFPLLPPSGNSDRFDGREQQVSFTWMANPFVTVATALVRFSPSAVLRANKKVGENFGMTEISLRL